MERFQRPTIENNQPEPDNWWQSLILVVIFATLCFLMAGCRTVSKVETVETVRVDSVVMYDTVYAEHHLVRYDTTYVYDSYKETYTIGRIDTVHQFRVDTVRVVTTKYIYKEQREEAADSTVRASGNTQKGTASEVRKVEKVTEKPVPLWKKAIVVLALVLAAGIFYIVGTWHPSSK